MTEPSSSASTENLPVVTTSVEPEYAAEMSDIELRDNSLAFIRRMIRKGAAQSTMNQAQYALFAHIDKAIRTAVLATGVDGEGIRVCWRRGIIAFLEELEDGD